MTIKHPCKTCKGEGLVEGLGEATVVIPRGTSYGDAISIKEKGHDSHNGKSGDLKIQLKVLGSRDPKDKRFKATGRSVWGDKLRDLELDETGNLHTAEDFLDPGENLTSNGYSRQPDGDLRYNGAGLGSTGREFRLDGRDIHSCEKLSVWEVGTS